MQGVPAVLRLERGEAGEEELAALAAVLLALRSRARERPVPPAVPGWQWWKGPGVHAAPGSWR